MIKSLYIRDYAVIESVTVNFERGLNIITGETGAGKSIIIDAMGLLLGERAAAEMVRNGAPKAIVEGIFDVTANSKVKSLFQEEQIESADELIIRREIAVKGNSRCFINDSPVSLATLRLFGDLLVDLHGQHEHQSLLRKETHIDFLDEFAGHEDKVLLYHNSFRQLQKTRKELSDILKREEEVRQKRDFLEFQLKEIESIGPQPEEDSSVAQNLRILENSHKILELLQSALDSLYEGDINAYQVMNRAKADIGALAKFDNSLEQQLEEIQTSITLIKDVAVGLQSYQQHCESDPERLELLRNRLVSLNMLKKKYGGSLGAVIEYRNKILEDLGENASVDDAISNLKKEITRLQKECGSLASEISTARKSAADRSAKHIVKVLDELGIMHAIFEVKQQQTKTTAGNADAIEHGNTLYAGTPKGFDEVEFFISTNTGEAVKPLASVASGGEVSRIMLSLKSVLAKSEKLPLLVFDEIDTGVSGRIAQRLGAVLRDLAKSHQIIAITHLPQIAGLADSHFVVEKIARDGRTVSSITPINQEERVREIAKLLSGENITDNSLKSAQELMIGTAQRN